MQVFPNLKDLKLNLYDEDHVDFIIKNMPQLEFLNGLPVEREDYDENSQHTDNKEDAVATTLVIEDEPDEESSYQFVKQNNNDDERVVVESSGTHPLNAYFKLNYTLEEPQVPNRQQLEQHETKVTEMNQMSCNELGNELEDEV